jgi:hypothetical protein
MKTKDLYEYYFDPAAFSKTSHNPSVNLIVEMVQLVMNKFHDTGTNENIKDPAFIMAWNTLTKLNIYKELPSTDKKDVSIIFKVSTKEKVNYFDLVIRKFLDDNNVKVLENGHLSSRTWFALPDNPIGCSLNKVRHAGILEDNTKEPNVKTGILEFICFSRIDGQPIFRAYRQKNDDPSEIFKYNPEENTFGNLETIMNAFTQPLGTPKQIGGLTSDSFVIELVHALEDHCLTSK